MAADDKTTLAIMAAILFATEQRNGSMDVAVMSAGKLMKKVKAQQKREAKKEEDKNGNGKDKDEKQEKS